MRRLLLSQLKKNQREINLTKRELKELENRLGTFSIIIRRMMDFNKAAEEDLLRDRDLFRQMGQIMTALNTKLQDLETRMENLWLKVLLNQLLIED
mgnify:CR=1 FL=1